MTKRPCSSNCCFSCISCFSKISTCFSAKTDPPPAHQRQDNTNVLNRDNSEEIHEASSSCVAAAGIGVSSSAHVGNNGQSDTNVPLTVATTEEDLMTKHHNLQTTLIHADTTSSAEDGPASTSHADATSSAPTSHADATSSSAEDGPSSAIPAIVKQDETRSHGVPSGGRPVQTVLDAISNKEQDLVAVEEENLDVDFNKSIDDIRELLQSVEVEIDWKKKSKEYKRKPKPDPNYFSNSKSLFNLKNFLSETGDFFVRLGDTFKENLPKDTTGIARDVLRTIGAVHFAAAGLLVVANILQRFEDVSDNRDECLSILREMLSLATAVQQIKERPRNMQDEIKKATEFIIEGSIQCCSQMRSSKFYKFLSTKVNREELERHAKELKAVQVRILLQLGIQLLDATQPKKSTLVGHYPKYAEGIFFEKQVREVMDLLEWHSNEKSVAVILHGSGGIGKSTLAQAVFSRLDIKGCRYSKVQLYVNANTCGDIVELQQKILKDLKPTAIEEIRTELDGQILLGEVLLEVQAFIYVDNVLGDDELRRLLPQDMDNTKKVRLLLTARDETHFTTLESIRNQFHKVKGLPPAEAMSLVKKVMDKRNDENNKISSIQMNEIVKFCRGVPLLLKTTSASIASADNKQNAFLRWKSEHPVDISEGERMNLMGGHSEDILDGERVNLLSGHSEDISGGERVKLMGAHSEDISEGEKVNLMGGLSVEISEGERVNLMGRHSEDISEGERVDLKGEHISEGEKVNLMGEHSEDISDGERVNLMGGHSEDMKKYFSVYDSLPQVLKDVFLDICIFFKGMDWEFVGDIVGMLELENLENRELVNRDPNGDVVSVHDVLFTLGCQMSRGTRLKSTIAFEITNFLSKNIQNITGIWLSDNKDLLSISAKELDFKSLRILHLGNSVKVDGKCNKNLGNLIFFQGAVSHLPFDVKEVKKLKYISYQPKDLNLPEMPPSLKHVDFSGSLHSRDYEISSRGLEQLKNLKILKVTAFAKLKKMPEELGHQLNGLQEIDLSYCESIEELPLSISRLQFLRILRIDHCSSLRHLPEDFGLLSSLQELHLQGCTNLKELPSSFEKLSSLKLLDLSSCQKLSKLPHGIGYLASLVKLSFKKCASLRSIPESIGRLKSLAFTMDMPGCSTLTELPCLFVQLRYIKELNLSECSSLQKLPESFYQLKDLVKLDLSNCSALQELCHGFHLLSSLRILNLSGCKMLEELPPDFHCLPSLQHLYLCSCHMLQGKSIDNLVTMKTLQILNIQGSSVLVRRLKELPRNQSWSAAVYTGQDLSKEEKDNIFQKLLPDLDNTLIYNDGRKTPLQISNLSPETLSLVIFHTHPNADFLCRLLEETIDIQKQLNFQIIYIGKHFNKFPSNVKDKILGYSPEIGEFGLIVVKLLLTLDVDVRQSWLSTLDVNVQESWLERYNAEKPIYFQMKMVEDNKKWRLRLKVLSNCDAEEFVLDKCEKYVKLMKLAETPPQSNTELLRELFGTKEGGTIFQRGHASNQDSPFTCGVDELKEKTILLEMGCMGLYNDIGLWSLAEMYGAEKDRLEIISIPTVQPSTKLNAFDVVSREVPWLVLKNPLTMTKTAKYFLIKQCGWKGDDIWHPSIIWIIEPRGRISICKPSKHFMLNMWGPKAYPFTEEKFEKIRKTERNQLENILSLEFLFKHLESVFWQVKKKMHEGRIICLYNGNKEFTSSIKKALIEVKYSLHIIYILRHGHKNKEKLQLTDTISKDYYSLEKPEMSQAEMEGMSLLNLSEYEAMRFWMRLFFIKEEINEMDNSVSQLCERLLELFQIKDEDHGTRWMIFMGKDGKLVAACRGEIMEWIFREDGEDRAKRLIKRLIKVSKEEGNQTGQLDSGLLDPMNMQTEVAYDQQVGDAHLDSLSEYASELLELVQLHQLLEFDKGETISTRPKVARHCWPTSIAGFTMLKNFLSEGRTVVDDIICQHPEEDVLEIVSQSLVEGISGKSQLAAAGFLVVVEILEKFESVSANRNECLSLLEERIECLSLLEEMNRVAQQFTERPHLSEGTLRKATIWIVHCSIMCCAQIEPSKFAMFFRGSVNKKQLRRLRKWLRRSQDDLYKNEDESGSLF